VLSLSTLQLRRPFLDVATLALHFAWGFPVCRGFLPELVHGHSWLEYGAQMYCLIHYGAKGQLSICLLCTYPLHLAYDALDTLYFVNIFIVSYAHLVHYQGSV
jgi:hypothetical protein